MAWVFNSSTLKALDKAKADKKAGNVAVEGCVASYVHFNSKMLGLNSGLLSRFFSKIVFFKKVFAFVALFYPFEFAMIGLTFVWIIVFF